MDNTMDGQTRLESVHITLLEALFTMHMTYMRGRGELPSQCTSHQQGTAALFASNTKSQLHSITYAKLAAH